MKTVLLIMLMIQPCVVEDPKPTPKPSPVVKPTPTPKPSPDPDPVVKPLATDCASVCEHYKVMKCIEAEPTKEGHTCTEICTNMRNSSLPGLNEYYQCVVIAQTCEQAKACD